MCTFLSYFISPRIFLYIEVFKFGVDNYQLVYYERVYYPVSIWNMPKPISCKSINSNNIKGLALVHVEHNLNEISLYVNYTNQHQPAFNHLVMLPISKSHVPAFRKTRSQSTHLKLHEQHSQNVKSNSAANVAITCVCVIFFLNTVR